MKFIILTLPMVCAFSSCSSIEATRESKGTILVAQQGSALKTFPEDTRITGAIDGRITPASKLKVSRTTYIKDRHVGDVTCEGYVDLSKPGWIEVRLVRPSYSGRAYQMLANGKHRLKKIKTESGSQGILTPSPHTTGRTDP